MGQKSLRQGEAAWVGAFVVRAFEHLPEDAIIRFRRGQAGDLDAEVEILTEEEDPQAVRVRRTFALGEGQAIAYRRMGAHDAEQVASELEAARLAKEAERAEAARAAEEA